ncbi:MAG: histidine kinase [Saprospiraceae bacterium]|nr:histidine kinase [Saprospiraceae bacterium]
MTSQQFQTLNTQYQIDESRVLFQDSYGFMWIGTNNGMLRYDGYNFRVFQPELNDSTALRGPRVVSIAEDHTHRMWVGTVDHGLHFFDRDRESFHQVCLREETGSCDGDISVYALSAVHDTLWVGTDRGLVKYLLNDTTAQALFTHTSDKTSLSHPFVRTMHWARDSILWVGTNDGVNRMTDNGQFVHYGNRPGYPNTQIFSIDQDPEGVIWVSARNTPDRLYIWDPLTDTFRPDPVFAGTGSEWGGFRFDVDENGELWISARSAGAYRYQPRTGTYIFFNPHQGAHHGFRGFYNSPSYVDAFGNFWSGGDVLHMWPRTNKAIQSIDSDGYLVLSVFATDEFVWFCGRKPQRWNKLTYETEDYWPSALPSQPFPRFRPPIDLVRIHSIQSLDQNTIAFTTTRNFFIWDLHDDSYREYPMFVGGPIRDFLMGQNNDVWLCTNQNSVGRLDLQTGHLHRLDSLGQYDLLNARTIARGADGTIWWGTSPHGVFRMDEATLAVEQIPQGQFPNGRDLLGTFVHEIHPHSDGSLWIATDRALHRMDPVTGQITYYPSGEPPVRHVVNSILEGDAGELWLGTKGGLVRFNPATSMSRIYTRADGLINNIYTEKSAFKSPSGMLYFGGDLGVDFFQPSDMGENTIPPFLYIDEIKTNNKRIIPPAAFERIKQIQIPFHQNFIEVQLIALHYTAPLATQYRYRINDGQWIDLGTSRNITLANASPGRYRLAAKAANADGHWCPEKQLLTIIVTPPWWRTNLFYILCALSVAGFAFVLYRNRIRQMRRKEQERIRINKLIAETEMKALRAQMNPHFIFNSLNSVQSLIAKKDFAEAKYYLSRFSQLIRQVLKNSRHKFVKLQDDLDALTAYLELEKFRFKNFTYKIAIGDGIDPDFIEVPPLVMQPYVENAIWHGLKHKTDGPGKIEIAITRNTDMVSIRIEDNGIGREQAQRLRTRSRSKQESLGMQITSDRLGLLQALYGHEARVQVTDLVDPPGTVVRIDLPIPD